VIHACPKERVERCDLLLASSVPSPSPSQIHHQCTYNDEPITKIKKKVNDHKETKTTFSANTKSDAKKEKKKIEKEEEKSAAEPNQMQIKILLCLLQKTQKQMQISLSLSLSLSLFVHKTHKINTKNIMTKNNKTALF
jgi:hypothetical protein